MTFPTAANVEYIAQILAKHGYGPPVDMLRQFAAILKQGDAVKELETLKADYKGSGLFGEIEYLARRFAARIAVLEANELAGCVRENDLRLRVAVLETERDQIAAQERERGKQALLNVPNFPVGRMVTLLMAIDALAPTQDAKEPCPRCKGTGFPAGMVMDAKRFNQLRHCVCVREDEYGKQVLSINLPQPKGVNLMMGSIVGHMERVLDDMLAAAPDADK